MMIFEKHFICIISVLLPVVCEVLSTAPDVIRIGAFFDSSESEDEAAFVQYVDNLNFNTSGLQMDEVPIHLELVVEQLSPTDAFRSAKKVCTVLQQGVVAVFGPKHPATASLVHTASSRHHLVHFNWEQNVLQWDDFSFSPVPTAGELGLALKDLIAAQRWTHFTIIYEHPDALFRLKEVLHLRSSAGGRSYHPSVRLRLLPPGADHRPLLRDIAKHGESNIVLDVAASRLTDILRYAQVVGIFSEYHNYIITTLDLHMVDLTDFQSVGANVTGFQLLNGDLWEDKKAVDSYNKMGIMPLFLRSRRPQLKLDSALTQDALHSLVSGLQTLSHMRSLSRPPAVRCGAVSSRPWSYALHLTSAIKKLNFVGQTGPFHLDDSGRRVNITLHVVQLKRSGLISIGTWTAHHGLNITFTYTMAYEEVLQTLKNKTLKITTLINPPYVMLKPLAGMLKGNDRFEGFCVDLIREIANILHFNYEFRLVRDGAYGSRDPKGAWNGMIRELIDREADLAIADLTISYIREEAVDFTMPFMTLGISILFRKPELEQTLLFFLTPLSVDVWVSMAMAYVGISVLLFLVARFSPYEWTAAPPCELIESSAHGPILRNHFTLLNSLWFTISAIMQQGCDASPRSTSARIIAAVWWFFSFVIISSYTANLASFLTRERMRSPIENAEDLAKQSEILYGCVKSGSTEAFFKESKFETYEKMWQTMASAQPPTLTESNAEGASRVRVGKYAFLMESTSIEYIVERDCELQQIGGLLDSKGYGIATPSGSPYRTHLSSAILQLQEKGTLQELKDRWWKVDAHHRCADDGSQVKPGSASELGLSKVGGVFVVLLAGLGLACVIAFAEFICKTRSMRRPIKVEEET
ncbi:glutamate receptor ionotropic, kainate 2-like [Ornithodoros turicata]|uniref:glutamate receptor ionotropic, kainate 2-like n=1 Tax=Ornithodoros turicata TaxID=34597 RepID=UPI003138844D